MTRAPPESTSIYGEAFLFGAKINSLCTSLTMPDKMCAVKNELFFCVAVVQSYALVLTVSVDVFLFLPPTPPPKKHQGVKY